MSNPLGMSDEEFMEKFANGTLNQPSIEEEAAEQPNVEAPPETSSEQLAGDETPPTSLDPAEPTQVAEGAPEAEGQTAAPESNEAVGEAAPTAEELTAFWNELRAPLKASGKVLEIKTPEEYRRLAQLGAHYGRRMQELAPARKAVAMLEQAGLLGNEERLSLALSAATGDRNAIEKLLGDQKIDPLDLDLDRSSGYTPDSYKVSDEDIRFSEALKEVTALPLGTELITEIDETWDKASQAKIYRHPETLEQFREARENGTFNQISGEVERLKSVGQIRHDEPFFDAYVRVGHYMLANNMLRPTSPSVPATNTVPPAPIPAAHAANPAVVGHRVVAPRQTQNDGNRARALSTPSRGGAAKPPPINPLAMSDEEYKKMFGNLPF